MELGHLLTRSCLTYPEVFSKVYHDSFCQSDSSISLPWVIYFKAFCLHVVSSFSCIPVICPKLVLFLSSLQFVYLFFNLSKCILLFFSCISSTLPLNVPYCGPVNHSGENFNHWKVSRKEAGQIFFNRRRIYGSTKGIYVRPCHCEIIRSSLGNTRITTCVISHIYISVSLHINRGRNNNNYRIVVAAHNCVLKIGNRRRSGRRLQGVLL